MSYGKKLLALIMALVLCVSMFPGAALADGETEDAAAEAVQEIIEPDGEAPEAAPEEIIPEEVPEESIPEAAPEEIIPEEVSEESIPAAELPTEDEEDGETELSETAEETASAPEEGTGTIGLTLGQTETFTKSLSCNFTAGQAGWYALEVQEADVEASIDCPTWGAFYLDADGVIDLELTAYNAQTEGSITVKKVEPESYTLGTELTPEAGEITYYSVALNQGGLYVLRGKNVEACIRNNYEYYSVHDDDDGDTFDDVFPASDASYVFSVEGGSEGSTRFCLQEVENAGLPALTPGTSTAVDTSKGSKYFEFAVTVEQSGYYRVLDNNAKAMETSYYYYKYNGNSRYNTCTYNAYRPFYLEAGRTVYLKAWAEKGVSSITLSLYEFPTLTLNEKESFSGEGYYAFTAPDAGYYAVELEEPEDSWANVSRMNTDGSTSSIGLLTLAAGETIRLKVSCDSDKTAGITVKKIEMTSCTMGEKVSLKAGETKYYTLTCNEMYSLDIKDCKVRLLGSDGDSVYDVYSSNGYDVIEERGNGQTLILEARSTGSEGGSFCLKPLSDTPTQAVTLDEARSFTSNELYSLTAETAGWYVIDVTAPAGGSAYVYTIESWGTVNNAAYYLEAGETLSMVSRYYGNGTDEASFTVSRLSGDKVTALTLDEKKSFSGNAYYAFTAEKEGYYTVELEKPEGGSVSGTYMGPDGDCSSISKSTILSLTAGEVILLKVSCSSGKTAGVTVKKITTTVYTAGETETLAAGETKYYTISGASDSRCRIITTDNCSLAYYWSYSGEEGSNCYYNTCGGSGTNYEILDSYYSYKNMLLAVTATGAEASFSVGSLREAPSQPLTTDTPVSIRNSALYSFTAAEAGYYAVELTVGKDSSTYVYRATETDYYNGTDFSCVYLEAGETVWLFVEHYSRSDSSEASGITLRKIEPESLEPNGRVTLDPGETRYFEMKGLISDCTYVIHGKDVSYTLTRNSYLWCSENGIGGEADYIFDAYTSNVTWLLTVTAGSTDGAEICLTDLLETDMPALELGNGMEVGSGEHLYSFRAEESGYYMLSCEYIGSSVMYYFRNGYMHETHSVDGMPLYVEEDETVYFQVYGYRENSKVTLRAVNCPVYTLGEELTTGESTQYYELPLDGDKIYVLYSENANVQIGGSRGNHSDYIRGTGYRIVYGSGFSYDGGCVLTLEAGTGGKVWVQAIDKLELQNVPLNTATDFGTAGLLRFTAESAGYYTLTSKDTVSIYCASRLVYNSENGFWMDAGETVYLYRADLTTTTQVSVAAFAETEPYTMGRTVTVASGEIKQMAVDMEPQTYYVITGANLNVALMGEAGANSYNLSDGSLWITSNQFATEYSSSSFVSDSFPMTLVSNSSTAGRFTMTKLEDAPHTSLTPGKEQTITSKTLCCFTAETDGWYCVRSEDLSYSGYIQGEVYDGYGASAGDLGAYWLSAGESIYFLASCSYGPGYTAESGTITVAPVETAGSYTIGETMSGQGTDEYHAEACFYTAALEAGKIYQVSDNFSFYAYLLGADGGQTYLESGTLVYGDDYAEGCMLGIYSIRASGFALKEVSPGAWLKLTSGTASEFTGDTTYTFTAPSAGWYGLYTEWTGDWAYVSARNGEGEYMETPCYLTSDETLYLTVECYDASGSITISPLSGFASYTVGEEKTLGDEPVYYNVSLEGDSIYHVTGENVEINMVFNDLEYSGCFYYADAQNTETGEIDDSFYFGGEETTEIILCVTPQGEEASVFRLSKVPKENLEKLALNESKTVTVGEMYAFTPAESGWYSLRGDNFQVNVYGYFELSWKNNRWADNLYWVEAGKTVYFVPTYRFVRGYSDSGRLTVEKAVDCGYAVRYEANGGEGAPAAQYKTDSALTLSGVVPTRSGYSFLGWATTADASAAKYQPGGSYTGNADIVLYAVWKASDTVGTLSDIKTDESPEELKRNVQGVVAEMNNETLKKDIQSGAALGTMETLEAVVGGAAAVNTDNLPETLANVDSSKISVVGANLNTLEDDCESATLIIAEPQNEDNQVPEGYDKDTVLSFSLTLKGVDDAADLDVPVSITIPVPEEMEDAARAGKLVILHYHSNGTVEAVVPTIVTVDGVLCARFVVSSFSDFAMAERTGKAGDVNGDNWVDILDVLHLLKYVAGQSVKLFCSGNVNGSGEVDILDVLHLLKYVAGQSVTLY